MGLPLASYPPEKKTVETRVDVNCSCCFHPFCESSCRQQWCRHWFRIGWSFINEVRLSAVRIELDRKLADCSFDYRLERSIGPSRCQVVIWLWIDPNGIGVSHSWASERLLWPEEFGSEFGGLVEENTVVPVSCCVFSLADMMCSDFPWTEYLEGSDFFSSTSFSELLVRAYAEAGVEECLSRSLRYYLIEDQQG